MPFRLTEFVRWADVDLAGIMRYDAYLRLVDVAETDFFRAIGAPIATLARRFGIWLPRKVVRMEYVAPVRLDDELRLALSVTRIGRTSLTLALDVAGADESPRATVELVLVCVATTQQLSKRELPVELVQMLSRFDEPRAGVEPGA